MTTSIKIRRHTLRNFGFLFGIVFLIAWGSPFLKGRPPRGWALAVAVLFVVIALIAPGILGPLYRIWMRLGNGLGLMNSMIILFLVWWLIITPIGLLRRMFGGDLIHGKGHCTGDSYRVTREDLHIKSMDRMF